MFEGVCDKSLVELPMVSTVNGPEFKIPSVSTNSGSRDSSSSGFPCFERRDDSIAWADRIYLSQMPPLWLAACGFLIHLTKSPLKLSMKIESSHWLFLLMLASIPLYIQQNWYHYLSTIPLYFHCKQ